MIYKAVCNMSNQDSNTKKIAYGELHFYYPFKFDNYK